MKLITFIELIPFKSLDDNNILNLRYIKQYQTKLFRHANLFYNSFRGGKKKKKKNRRTMAKQNLYADKIL